MTTQLDDDTLQRYYDGELSPVEERTVRALVEGDPKARARLAEFAQLSEMLRDTADELGASVDSDGLFAAIQSDVQKQGELGFGQKFEVVREEWATHRRGTLVSVAAGFAVAAAALLVVLAPGRDGASAPQVATAPEAAAPAVHGSRVENVDFGANTGTVFEIESAGVSTAVVWISDDEGDTP